MSMVTREAHGEKKQEDGEEVKMRLKKTREG